MKEAKSHTSMTWKGLWQETFSKPKTKKEAGK